MIDLDVLKELGTSSKTSPVALTVRSFVVYFLFWVIFSTISGENKIYNLNGFRFALEMSLWWTFNILGNKGHL